MNALHHGRSLRRQVGPATTATARRCRPVRSRVMDAARGESRTALTGDMNASQQTTAWFAAARLGWKKMACGRRREARVAGGSRPESERSSSSQQPATSRPRTCISLTAKTISQSAMTAAWLSSGSGSTPDTMLTAQESTEEAIPVDRLPSEVQVLYAHNSVISRKKTIRDLICDRRVWRPRGGHTSQFLRGPNADHVWRCTIASLPMYYTSTSAVSFSTELKTTPRNLTEQCS
jgi:hypothetical protein